MIKKNKTNLFKRKDVSEDLQEGRGCAIEKNAFGGCDCEIHFVLFF